MHADRTRIGYVVKMYPRFSETFVVTELLAHEAADADLEIFSLRPPNDSRFHAELASVQAPVTYIESRSLRSADLWERLRAAGEELPSPWQHGEDLLREDVRDALQALELARLVRRRGIEHLHAHFGSVATTVARLASRLAGVPYSFTAHAKDIFHDSVQPEDLRRKLADAAAVVTVSDFNAAYLRRHHGAAASSVRRVYNGLPLRRFEFRAPAARPPVIAAVGRLVPKKGFDDLVTACGLLASRGVAFECRIIGGGPLEDALARQVAALGLEDRVRLLGPRPQDEVRELVRDAAAFAAPCVVDEEGNRDGLPTVLLEAMALGTPCVSTPVTGIPEVVRHAETGLLVAERDPDGLADALHRLLREPRLAERLAGRARQLVEEEFDAAEQARKVREHILGPRNLGPRPPSTTPLPALAAVR